MTTHGIKISPATKSAGNLRGCKLVLLSTILLFLFTGLVVSAADTKTGRITGKVVDTESNEVIVGASIYIENTALGAISDVDGNFLVRNVPAGVYSLKVKAVGYEIVAVSSITVIDSKETDLTFKLQPTAAKVEDVIVKSKAVENTSAVVLKHRHKARNVTDVLSAEDISRSGSGDAAEAMTRVVGATVTEGKYVYIRGLGDRYSNTQLNGTLLPTSDPDKQSVQMDLIPSKLLDNIVVSKSFSPDKPGNFSGGSVDLRTKDFPEFQSFTISAGGGINSNVINNSDFLTFDKGGLNISSTWDTPEADALGNDWVGFTKSIDTAQFVEELGNTFNKNIAQSRKKGPMNGSFSAAYGNQVSFLGNPLGLNASLTYNKSNKFYDDGIDGRWRLPSGGDPELVIGHYLHDTKATEEELWGGLVNLAYKIHRNHNIGISYMNNTSNETETRYLQGGAPEAFSLENGDTTSSQLQARVLEYNERKLNCLQLKGNHYFSDDKRTQVNWQASYSKSQQETPDQRFFNNRVIYYDMGEEEWLEEPEYTIDPTEIGVLPTRYFRDVDETNKELGLDLAIPLFSQTSFKTGFSTLNKTRNHDERIFEYFRTGQFSGDPVDYYSSIGYETYYIVNPRTGETTGVRYDFVNFIDETTTGSNKYDGNQDILGTYGMFEFHIFSKLTAVTGVRMEKTDMFIENGYPTDDLKYASGEINKTDWLPSLNLAYELSQDMKLRFAYGRTLARPTLREFAPYANFDFGGSGKLYNGNPDLKLTTIQNFDLRWEWFGRPGEVVTVSTFYKKFKNPIEMVIVSTNEDQIMPQNIDEGRLIGAEFEVQSGLDVIHSSLANFKLGANLTLIDSKVDIPESELILQRAYDPGAPDTRQMYGQAPYVINLSLGYSNYNSGTSTNIQLNRVGKRFSINSGGGTPDVYEKPHTMLDVIFTQKVIGDVKFKLSAKNVLDSKHTEVYEFLDKEYIYQKYGTGRSISFGLSYVFE